MNALSLTQPWAQLVIVGAKKLETRTWGVSNNYGRIAIHASKSFPGYAQGFARWPLVIDKLGPDFIDPFHPGYPLGKVLGTVELVRCDRILKPEQRYAGDPRPDPVPPATSDEYKFGDFSAGRHVWTLRDPNPLPIPIACKGALGLWRLPPSFPEEFLL